MNIRGLLLISLLFLSLFSAPVLAQEEAAPPDLRVGSLPVLNISVLVHAWYSKYFEEEGTHIGYLRIVQSAQRLRELISADEIDVFMADLITALVLLEEGYDVRVARHVEISNFPLFGVVARADSGLMSGEELSGARIGISERTIVQYVTGGMLASVGVSADDVEYVDVPGILDRLDQLLAGEIQVASLPEPMKSKAVQEGHHLLIDDSVVPYVPEALVFTTAALAEKGDAVRAFLRAVERSVTDYNNFEDFDAGAAGLSDFMGYVRSWAGDVAAPPILRRYVTNTIEGELWPNFALARVPTEEEFAMVQDWALDVGLVMEARAYEDVIDGSFLPEMMADNMAEEGEESDE